MKNIILILVIFGSFHLSIGQDTLVNYYEGLTINEFYVGEKGVDEYHWIELYNNSDHEIELKGLFLTSSKDELRMFELDENTLLDTGSYFQIYLNKIPSFNEQTAFINVSNGENYFAIVYTTSNGIGQVIDDVNYEANIKHNQRLTTSIGRFPNGTGDWLIMEYSTPNRENTGQVSKGFYAPTFLIGAKLGYGINNSKFLKEESSEVSINLSPYMANSWGVYARLNTYRLYFTTGIMYRNRKYKYDYSLSDSTHKSIFTRKVSGKQFIGAIALDMGVGTYITSKINVFTGLNLGVTISSKFKYTEELNALIKKENDEGEIVWESLKDQEEYPEESNYTSADILKINVLIGARYELHENIHFTLMYMTDIIGINITEDDLKRTMKFRTVLIGVEIPFTIGEEPIRSWF